MNDPRIAAQTLLQQDPDWFEDLWLQYWANGGNADKFNFDAYVHRLCTNWISLTCRSLPGHWKTSTDGSKALHLLRQLATKKCRHLTNKSTANYVPGHVKNPSATLLTGFLFGNQF